MSRFFRDVPPHIRARLAAALESNQLSIPTSQVSLSAVLGTDEFSTEVASSLASLGQLGLSGRAAGAWIRALDEAMVPSAKPDLVWSGPGVPGLHSRSTRRVYEELLGTANRTLWISSFAFFDGPRAFEVVAVRMEAVQSLSVRLLLNIQRPRGDTAPPDQVVRRYADQFWKRDWPGSRRPYVYFDPRSLDLDGPSGVLHAKAVVADSQRLLVTSANLTEAALDRNVELGILVNDRELALATEAYFQGLIDLGQLRPLPLA